MHVDKYNVYYLYKWTKSFIYCSFFVFPLEQETLAQYTYCNSGPEQNLSILGEYNIQW